MNEQANTSNNTEIDKALKEFETKSDIENTSKATEASKSSSVPQNAVEGVTFEVPSYRAVKYYQETDTPRIIKLVVKFSGVKEQKHAEYILLGFVIIAMGVSFYLFFGRGIGVSTNQAIIDKTIRLHLDSLKQ